MSEKQGIYFPGKKSTGHESTSGCAGQGMWARLVSPCQQALEQPGSPATEPLCQHTLSQGTVGAASTTEAEQAQALRKALQ